MTYTVVAWDPATRELGLGTVSHSGAVLGKILTRAGDGDNSVLVASQAFSSLGLGRDVAEVALAGGSADELVELCRLNDANRFRQVLAVSTQGTLAGFTGAGCLPQSSHLIDHPTGVAIGGNMLHDGAVLAAGHRAFAETDGTLANRILTALDACGAAGGDFRGDRAAGLVTLTTDGLTLDLRVDDHREPHAELRRLHALALKRAVLADCYDWVGQGCERGAAERLADRLEPDAADDDIGGWLWVLTGYAELPPPTVGPEARRLGQELLFRLANPARDGVPAR